MSGPAPAGPLVASWRMVLGATMPLLGPSGRLYLQGGDLAPAGLNSAETAGWVEELDPQTLEPLRRSPSLPGGPWWAGGGAVLDDGSVLVVHGRHAHRLDADTLEVLAARRLDVGRPHNSFVRLPETGLVVTKNIDLPLVEPARLQVLEATTLEQVAAHDLDQTSIARLSATVDDDGSPLLVVVGVDDVVTFTWSGVALHERSRYRYRTEEGQGFGWDPVLASGSAWFLDDGDGTPGFQGTFRGRGIATAPLRLHRVPLDGGPPSSVEVCGLPGGIVANPPVVDEVRRLALAYDSGNGVVVGVAFDDDPAAPLRVVWRREQDQACHQVLWSDDGIVLTNDHDPATGDQVVLLELATGEERARVATGSPIQSMLFPAAMPGGAVYLTTPMGISRIASASLAG